MFLIRIMMQFSYYDFLFYRLKESNVAAYIILNCLLITHSAAQSCPLRCSCPNYGNSGLRVSCYNIELTTVPDLPSSVYYL